MKKNEELERTINPPPTSTSEYYLLNSEDVDPKRLKLEREKARKLRKSQWWFRQIQPGQCHYCQKSVEPSQLTLDHIVPLARGGQSTPGNVVPACRDCNLHKKLDTPVDEILRKLRSHNSD
jgi:5-methylcytosine-specific restriction endonuclease McrA